jgi:hypothetical protein
MAKYLVVADQTAERGELPEAGLERATSASESERRRNLGRVASKQPTNAMP